MEGVIVIASWIFDETNLLANVKKNAVPLLIVGRDLTSRGITSYLLNATIEPRYRAACTMSFDSPNRTLSPSRLLSATRGACQIELRFNR